MSNLMSTSLLAAVAAPTLTSSAVPAATVAPIPAGANDAARLQSLLQAPEPSTPTDNRTQAVAGQLPRPAPIVGEGLVKTLTDVSSDIKGVFSAAEQAAASGNLTVAEGLRLQLSVSQMLIHWDLLNKGISKTPQIVDTLVKTQ